MRGTVHLPRRRQRRVAAQTRGALLGRTSAWLALGRSSPPGPGRSIALARLAGSSTIRHPSGITNPKTGFEMQAVPTRHRHYGPTTIVRVGFVVDSRDAMLS